ncbi:MAG: ethylbenzene dehydrogenase-related protein, partial [Anaerolineae bacterium]|nr:ethylbenzene dehydrogenase-related protein [Anaerolineae bacterium]
MSLTTEKVRVGALTDGREIAFRLQWIDGSNDDRSVPARFADACAVQLPAKTEPSLPAPQMGEPGRPVEIVYWNAAWQAAVDGRGDTIRDLYPNASVDHYPFEAKSLEPGSPEQIDMAARYAPARALDNAMAGPRTTPVQDLTAEGPGTLSPRPAGGSTGRGRRTADGWAVVIRRKLPQGFSVQTETQVAFAVWEGAHQE